MSSRIIEKEVIMQNSEGEIIGAKTERTVSTVSDEPPFVKIYLNTIGMLTGLHQGIACGLLGYLLRYATYASDCQLVVLNANIRKTIMEKLGMSSRSTFLRHLTALEEAGIIHGNDFTSKQQRYNTIALNPIICGKGSWKEVKKLRMEIIVEGDGKGKFVTALTDGRRNNTKAAAASVLKWDWNKEKLKLIFCGGDTTDQKPPKSKPKAKTTKTTWVAGDLQDFTPKELYDMEQKLHKNKPRTEEEGTEQEGGIGNDDNTKTAGTH